MNRLFIRLTEMVNRSANLDETVTLANNLVWLLYSDTGTILDSGANISSEDLRHYLLTKGYEYQEVVFFPPEHRIQVRRLTLTKGQHRHIDKIAPYLLEEFLAQPPEELHLTLLNKGNKHTVWVSVVAKTQMDIWLSALTLMGWQNPMILSVTGLLPFWPEQEQDTTLLFATTSGNYLLKEDDTVTYVPNQLAALLPKRERYQICCAKEKQATLPTHAAQCTVLAQWSEQETNADGQLENELFTLAQLIQNDKQLLAGNLCHGVYKQKNAQKTSYSGWWWAAALLLFCLAAELFLTIKHTTELTQQADNIATTSRNEFLKLVPDEGRVFHLQRQIQSRIQRAKQGQQTNGTLNLYEVMAIIDQLRAQITGSHRIIRFDFSSNTVRLDWQAQKRETLDQVRTSLQKTNLNALMEQVAKRGEGYVASIKITMGGKG